MDKKQGESMHKFGLIGKNISYSFSRSYFEQKFKNENITEASYENFDIKTIEEFPNIIKNTSSLKGLNVTIPYKKEVIHFLNKIDKKAKKIGAVNTIKITKKGETVGYNTDFYGFKKSLKPHLKPHHQSALILGTGGASKAIAYALKRLKIEYTYVSRDTENNSAIGYKDITPKNIKNYQIIINCTPLGTYPNIKDCPDIPYQALTEKHLLYDLVYNPEESQFLKNGKSKNTTTVNGLKMLILQAEKAWKIWNKK